MHRKTYFHLWYLFLVSVMMLVINGCGTVVVSTTPPTTPPLPLTPPTDAPPYIHYAPAEESNIHLEFDYPGYWVFNEEKLQFTNITSISFGDPRILAMPTRSPDQSHSEPHDFGTVYIKIEPINPGQSLADLIEAQEQIYENAGSIEFLRDYPIEIDGVSAHAMETLNDFPEEYSSIMFYRRILFVFNDQVYTIDLMISEADRGGEFEKGYDYFFNSLKIVP